MKSQTSENRREFIREASKIVHEWNVHPEIFSRLLQTDILQKTVVGCPWLNNVKFRKRRVLTFQIVFITFFQIDVQSLHTGSHDFTEVSKITQVCRLKRQQTSEITQCSVYP